MTTNCIVPPKDSYKGRLWTTGATGFPGCRHIDADENGHKDFSELIAQAKTCPAPTEIERVPSLAVLPMNRSLPWLTKWWMR